MGATGKNMPTQDKCCTVVPCFKVSGGKLPAFRELCGRLAAKSKQEPKCLHYKFTFNGDQAYCLENYEDAEGMLTHIQNVAALLEEAQKMARITRFEIHGPAEELAKLREPLAKLKPKFFTLECGFRR
jgi:quinol monooxygenase YgiN